MPAGLRCCALAAVLLPLALAGCSGTRLGDTLSRSFSGAPAPSAAGSVVSGAGAGGSASTTAPPSGSTPLGSGANAGKTSAAGTSPAIAIGKPSADGKPLPQGKPRSTTATTAPPLSATSSARALPLPSRPAPYRVTILLPQADASAPAEVVTQALRAAGVPFEVETIERIGSGSSLPGAGTAVPSTQATPSVRPAPAPR